MFENNSVVKGMGYARWMLFSVKIHSTHIIFPFIRYVVAAYVWACGGDCTSMFPWKPLRCWAVIVALRMTSFLCEKILSINGFSRVRHRAPTPHSSQRHKSEMRAQPSFQTRGDQARSVAAARVSRVCLPYTVAEQPSGSVGFVTFDLSV